MDQPEPNQGVREGISGILRSDMPKFLLPDCQSNQVGDLMIYMYFTITCARFLLNKSNKIKKSPDNLRSRHHSH